uniref:ATP synthase F(0) complex subunit C1, mitochondrial n=1 Tax=Sus scrofa TaxID=9823 RepID=A0A480HDH9_PIG
MALESKQQGRVGDLHEASHGEEDKEGDHQTEEPHGLRQGKAQNGIGEELLLQRWVPGIANDQAAKHCSNASPGTSHTNCGGPSTNKLGRCVNVPGDNTGLELPPGHLEWDTAAGRLFRWDFWPTQEGGRHRPDQAPGTRAEQSRRNE